MGPLAGLRVVEFAGIGPAPFCAMMLADQGAEVVRIEKRGVPDPLGQRQDVLARGRRSLALDLKRPEGLGIAMRLIERADVLIEGFRPGVMERLGLGPDPCLAGNPRLVYGRMTGWGQDGPLAATAGHDLDYIALSGALSAIGHKDGPPLPPLNLVGDFGGGGMLLAFGLLAALFEAGRSGRGQVVDAAMTDGSALMMAMIYSLKGNGLWPGGRGENLLDGAAPHYRCYRCADGAYLAVAPLEPHFWAQFLARTGLDAEDLPDPADRAAWPRLAARLEALFAGRPRADWLALFEGSDCCVAPVLDLDEAPLHPHNRARESFLVRDGVMEPSAAPRFSRTPGQAGNASSEPGRDGAAILAELGYANVDITALQAAGVV